MADTPPTYRGTGIVPRIIALGVFALSAGVLVYVHRADIWPAAPIANPVDAAFMRCFADSAAKIDRMRSEGTIKEAQWRLFRDRAEARCRSQAGSTGGPPSLPAVR